MATAEQKTELITQSIDRSVVKSLAINRESGGMSFQNMSEVMDFAKLMSVSQHAVPPHCRGQVGLCLGLAIQAVEWRMSPFAVANKSYVVNDRLGYESQLIHAVIEQRAPITSRLRHEFSGAGPTRRCRVWATARGEAEPLEYTSPEFSTITPKNSPLWKAKPDLQLYYNTSRDWARAYFPDVILGVYSDDELQDSAVMEHAPKASGMAGLKSRMIVAEVVGPEDDPADEVEQEQEDVEEVAEEEEAVEETTDDNPAGPTAEEMKESALFDKGRQQYE